MSELAQLYLFVVASLVLLLTPGPAVLYVVARSVNQGRIAGIVSVLGLEFGTLFHVAAAALGISAVLLSSALAFNVVKYLGAAYLIYLGIHKLLSREEVQHDEGNQRASLKQIFWQGVIVNVLNPKTALFFLHFSHNLSIFPRATLHCRCYFLAVCLCCWQRSVIASMHCWLDRLGIGYGEIVVF